MKRILATLLSLVLLMMLMPTAMPASAATEVSNIAINVVAPEAGRNPRYEVSGLPTGLVLDAEDDIYGEAQENGVVWFCEEQPVPASACFEVGKVYKVRVLLIRASEEYTVAADPTRTINGQNAYLQYGNDMYIVLEYTFPALEGHTITFSAGSGSGTMPPVNNIAGEYTLPTCSFTAPHSSQVFKCWKISTDLYEWQPGEKIPVYEDTIVTAVWKNKDSRVEVFDVEASAEDLASIPLLYGKKSIPQINTTNGHPAYVTDSTGNLQWQRKVGDSWVYDNGGRFTPGEWRIITQVRIDERSDPSNQFVLGDPVTLTVNGQAWTAENGTGKPTVAANYSMIFFVSPSFVIVDNPNILPPASVGQVTLRLEGYRSGNSVANAVVKGNDRIKIGETVFFEADSAQDFVGGNPAKIREATGTFSTDKAYAVTVTFTAKDSYIIEDLTGEDVSFENAIEFDERIFGDTFKGVYFLNPPMTNPFVDVKKSDYFCEPVLWAVEKEITNGMDATHFAPANGCTRGQVVTFLWRAAGKPKDSGSNPFVDVKKTDYFYDAVLWAVENGITNGMDATHFAPDATCTRGQIVTFLYRAAGKPKVSGSNPFVDVKKTDYFYDAVLWAVGKGITNGMDATHFGPDSTCTRGQVVTFLYRKENNK